MQSCLYEGRVRHRRRSPVAHAFEFPLFLVYLDLGELDEVFRGRWLWSTRRPALAWFRRSDHLGDPALPLERCVRDLVEERSGRRPTGPIRLLTHLRYAGFAMNPVSFLYCFAEGGEELEAVVAEVTNTPWGERHCYVLAGGDGAGTRPAAGGALRLRTAKQLHVSPFMPMELFHDFSIRVPGRRLGLRIADRTPAGETVFDAVLALERREIDGRTLASALLRHPLVTLRVAGAIYWQALRLRSKGAPFHPHPRARREPLEIVS